MNDPQLFRRHRVERLVADLARRAGPGGEPDDRGNPTWDVHAAEPEPREGGMREGRVNG